MPSLRSRCGLSLQPRRGRARVRALPRRDGAPGASFPPRRPHRARARAKPLQKPDARKAWLDAAVAGRPAVAMKLRLWRRERESRWLDAALRLAKRDAEAFVPELHATLTDTVHASPGATLKDVSAAVSQRAAAWAETRAPFARWTAAHYARPLGVAIDAPQLGEALEPLYEGDDRVEIKFQTPHAIDATLSLIQVPDGTPRAPQAAQGPRHLPQSGRHPRRRRALEGLGRAPAPARPNASRAQGAPLAAPGLARRRSRRAAADAGAAGGPGRRLPPPRGEHVRGLRGRRPAGRRLPRRVRSRLEPLLVSVQAFSASVRVRHKAAALAFNAPTRTANRVTPTHR